LESAPMNFIHPVLILGCGEEKLLVRFVAKFCCLTIRGDQIRLLFLLDFSVLQFRF
jgi:hypothetical protein